MEIIDMKSTKLVKLGVSLSVLLISVGAHAAKPNHGSSADAAVLQTIVALDKNEILAGVVASHLQSKSSVLDFANMMIKDHGKNLTDALQLANKMKALPLNAAKTSDLSKKGADELVKLAGLPEDQFNKAYVDAMVQGHEDALKLIDSKLMKETKDQDLVKFLTDTRSAVNTHLEDAKKLQKDLS
jgi:putative membrane protein